MFTAAPSNTQRPVESFVSYLTVNKIHRPHKDQPVDAAQGSTHCLCRYSSLLWTMICTDTLRFVVWEEPSLPAEGTVVPNFLDWSNV